MAYIWLKIMLLINKLAFYFKMPTQASMVELADTADSKSVASSVWVRVPLLAPKSSHRGINMIENNKLESLYPKGSYTCPICNKEFEATEDTRYIIGGGYTCSWKCFLTEHRKREAEKEAENKRKRKTENNT